MKTKKQNFWRILAVGPDNLSVLEQMARDGKSARKIVDVIVGDFGLYNDEVKSGKLKRATLEQQARRWKNSFLRQRDRKAATPGTDLVPVNQRTELASAGTLVPNSHVANIREQIEAQEKIVARLTKRIAEENELVAKMLRADRTKELKVLDSLYRTLTAARRGDDQHMRGRDRSHLFKTDEATQKSAEFEISVLQRQQVHEMMPEFFRALQWQPGDPDAPPALAQELSDEDARIIRQLARKYGLSRNTTRL